MLRRYIRNTFVEPGIYVCIEPLLSIDYLESDTLSQHWTIHGSSFVGEIAYHIESTADFQSSFHRLRLLSNTES